jgi:hypothetical protein
MLDWFKAAAREPGGFYGYYKTLAEERRDSWTVGASATYPSV